MDWKDYCISLFGIFLSIFSSQTTVKIVSVSDGELKTVLKIYMNKNSQDYIEKCGPTNVVLDKSKGESR